MRTGRFGGLLLATGAAVGMAAVVGLVVGFEPSRLPAAMLDIAVYKLTFAAAAGLLAAGAIIRRHGGRDRSEPGSPPSVLPESETARPLLQDAPLGDFAPKHEAPVDAGIPKRR